VLTLSGLRGQLVGCVLVARTARRSPLSSDALTFRATLHRAARPHALPPLPPCPPQSSYPAFAVSSTATLPLPARATKPPRPGVRAAPRSMPFAALFGRPATPPPPTPTTTDDPTIDIAALVIDTALSRADIATRIISALKCEIAVALNDHPPWIVERVHAFALPYFPFVKVPAGKKKLQDIGGNPNRVAYAVNAALHKPEELADAFQAFYRAVEGELRNVHAEGDQAEAQIRDVLETIEATLCSLLYDR
jgi:hypothetical protein